MKQKILMNMFTTYYFNRRKTFHSQPWCATLEVDRLRLSTLGIKTKAKVRVVD